MRFGLLLSASLASATFRRGNGIIAPDGDDDEDDLELATLTGGSLHRKPKTDNQTTTGWGTFEQLIDHANPGLGTFSQRYWYGTEHWRGPGSPIFMMNPGEQSAEGFNKSFVGDQRLPMLFAKETGGAVVIMEHRYWGGSSPYENLTAENLQYLTLQNSLLDNTYFAQNLVPPFDPSGRSSPDKAPWIFSGGSYPGALAGWLAALEPGTFWAYHGTSGVVEAVGDFWQYFTPVLEATPENCTADVTAVIDHIDHLLLHGSETDKESLKKKFKLQELEDADFAAALENGPWSWQSGQYYTGTERQNPYYQFCDYVENAWPNSTEVPGPEGVGLHKALDGYARWVKELLLPGYCESYGYDDWKGEYNTGCFANSNASSIAYHDLSVDNYVNRQWNWLLCNEPFKFWQDGAPENRPSLVSRLVDVDYWEAQCALFFPEGGYGIAKGKTVEDVNSWTGGWSVENTTRLLYANGQFDPWRDATVSSKDRPGGPLESTPELPVFVLPGGTHCSDYYKKNWEVNVDARRIAYEETAIIKLWTDQFYLENPHHGKGKW
ncbi:Serine carboxypeptidase S28 [Geosmithia morbida]|uniref:Serine carboxypeptidase S28 n=1 Tax=Geosmithia morbida TaxID=1094350 RepID=A0A9P4Z2L7_9HYPO|nr:Serine carboxypeptidase S28 [Geosmithia morbida]KAF4126088.1 Serine carboxypeptidase S28 [Geosmithia morbida]